MKFVLSAALVLAAAAPLAAQTVITPSNAVANSWFLFDGSGPGTDPAQITGAQPRDGNGSLQFTVSASNQQPSAEYYFGANTVALSSLSSFTLGYSFLTPTGTVPASSPTIRLLLNGIGGNGARTDGSLGWYLDGSSNSWVTQSLALNSGNFFFRLGGNGQAADDCKSANGNFDDRRQAVGTWIGDCTGANGTFDLSNAYVTGIQVDWGTFVAPGAATSFADDVFFTVGTNQGSFNFETTAAATGVTPEPATLSLLATGLVGLAGVARRKRSK